jgi:hypothetical protein
MSDPFGDLVGSFLGHFAMTTAFADLDLLLLEYLEIDKPIDATALLFTAGMLLLVAGITAGVLLIVPCSRVGLAS